MLHSRIQRVEELVRHTLAELLLLEVKDERLRQANVTGVKVSRDLQHAVVSVSCVNLEPGATEELFAGLERARGWLRRELGHRVRLKYTPDLKFIPDHSAERAARIEGILREVLPESEELTEERDAGTDSSGEQMKL